MNIRKLRTVVLPGFILSLCLIAILSSIRARSKNEDLGYSGRLGLTPVNGQFNHKHMKAKEGNLRPQPARGNDSSNSSINQTLERMRNHKFEVALQEIESFAEQNIEETSYTKPLTILIVSSWRSGSTFFAEAISSHPGVFYHYEPLTGFEDLSVSSPDTLKEALFTLESLGNCEYNRLDKYLMTVKKDSSILSFNEKLAKACEYLGSDCYNSNFLSKACNNFPIQLFKLVRISIRLLPTFLEANSHIIFLVRDPRAVFASRLKLEWCRHNSQCNSSDKFCNEVTKDLETFNILQHQFPTQMHLVKFEDLALNPEGILKDLFASMEILWHLRTDKYLVDHTREDIENPWSTHRVSRLRIDHWKPYLPFHLIAEIQQECEAFMSELNYTAIITTR